MLSFQRPLMTLLPFLGVALISSAAAADSLEVDLMPHVGDWRQHGNTWSTDGERPPAGWYLRSDRQYHLRAVEFEVRKQTADGICFLYTGDWHVMLRPDEIMVRQNSYWDRGKKQLRKGTKFFMTATRPISFGDTQWHTCRFELTGRDVVVHWDGAEVMSWSSPQAEWAPVLYHAGKLAMNEQMVFPTAHEYGPIHGVDQDLILHAFTTGASFRNVRVAGSDTGPSDGFRLERVYSGFHNKADYAINRVAPLEPVRVTEKLDKSERAKAAVLPAVRNWKPALVDPPRYYGISQDGAVDNVLKTVDWNVQGKNPAGLPRSLYFHEFSERHYGNRKMPQAMRIYFNLAEAGPYTLKLDMGRFARTGTMMEVLVDGQVVTRVVYRALAQGGPPPGDVRDYIPLQLDKGPHRVDIRLNTEDFILNFDRWHRRMLLNFDAIEFVPGIHEPRFVYKAGEVNNKYQQADALADPYAVGEQVGKILRYRITGLDPAEAYTVYMQWVDVDVNKPGERLMDVVVNGSKVEDDLDVVAEVGYRATLERTYRVVPREVDGEQVIDLRLEGHAFKAFLNGLEIRDQNGDAVLAENCGWHPFVSRWYFSRRYDPKTDRRQPLAAEPPRWTPESIFDGHNLLANPHFSLVDEERGAPRYWFSFNDLRDATLNVYPIDKLKAAGLSGDALSILERRRYTPHVIDFYELFTGSGDYEHDPAMGRERPGALRVSDTEPDFAVCTNWVNVDHGKLQRFSVWVRTRNVTGTVRPELLWFRNSMHGKDNKWLNHCSVLGVPLSTPRTQYIRRHEGDELTGTQDWTRLEVTARPPLGAVFAACAVRVDNNTGGRVWIDDAEYNGYGAEPLEISYSLAGLHPQSDKHVVVRSLTKAPVQCRVVHAESGRVAAQGEATYGEQRWWTKRHYYHFAFDQVREPGLYKLVAVQNGRRRATEPFRIQKTVYDEVVRKLMNALHIKRWNYDLPHAHAPGALEDAHMLAAPWDPRFSLAEQRYFPERRDMSGGWYDAGDDIRHVEFWGGVLHALLMADRYQDVRSNDWSEDDIRDELVWGARAIIKYQYAHGGFFVGVKPNKRATDNVPFYERDRYAAGLLGMPQTGGILAEFAYRFRDRQPELAQSALDAALKNYRYNALWKRISDEDYDARKRFLCAPKALLFEMYAYKLTGDEVYRERLSRHAPVIAEGLKAGHYRGTDELDAGAHKNATAIQDFFWVPCHFIQLYPNHAAVPALRDALRVVGERIKRVSDLSLYGQALDLHTPDDQAPKRWPKDRRGSGAANRIMGYWLAVAYSAAEIGMTLDDPDLIRVAGRQLQYMLGKNFADLSMVHGVGSRTVAGGDQIYNAPDFFRNWLAGDKQLFYYDGDVVSMAMRDFGREPLIEMKTGDGFFPPLRGIPPTYCQMHLTADYPYHPAPS